MFLQVGRSKKKDTILAIVFRSEKGQVLMSQAVRSLFAHVSINELTVMALLAARVFHPALHQ